MNEYINRIDNLKRKILSLDQLYNIIADGDAVKVKDFKTRRYDEFYHIIKDLEKEGKLIARGKHTNGYPNKLLSLEYKRITEVKEQLTGEEKLFVHNLHNDIYKYTYQRNADILRKDREMLIKIDEFLREKDSKELLSVKERSQSLFNDEKLLQASGIKNRTKLSYDDLKCKENPQPLLCFPNSSFYSKKQRNIQRKILIIENLDTYWTFHKVIIAEGLMQQDINDIDMVVYGQGYKIAEKEYDFSFYGINSNDLILYFGDLDSEGLRIYQIFKEKFKYLNISLCLPCYEFLIGIGLTRGFGFMPNQNSADYKRLENDIQKLSEEKKKIFKKVIEEKLFVPQEALNIEELRRNIGKWKI